MRHAWLLLAIVGCKEAPPVETPDGPQLVEIQVLPEELVVESGPDGAAPQPFEAIAVYDDGQQVTLDAVEWTVSNRSAGEIDEEGLFWASDENGGVTWVTARLDEVEGRSTVTVIYREEKFVEEVDPTLFDGPKTNVYETWLYPEDGVNIPRNTPSIHFQWNNLAADAYRLRFRSELTDLTVYTTQNQWIADNEVWTTIAATNAGGQVWVDLWASVGGEVLQEPPISVSVNRFDAEGSVIYWSTSVAGFVEIPFGGQAQDFLTQAQAGRCVGCHSISSTGEMAFTYDGGNGSLGVKRVDDQSDVIPYGSGNLGNFKTFSPDGRFLLSTYLGNLYLYDAPSGAYLGAVREMGDVTHVDWSPDDTRIALTLTEGHTNDWTVGGTTTRIALMDHLGDGTFANLRAIVEAPAGWRAYYPAWSPDGEWIAFNMSTGDCYDDPDAEMWVVDGDGLNEPIRLDNANLDAGLTNSWPRWGPLPDDDVLWLAVASKRNYGFQTAGNPQIWVAAFDPVLAEQGQDPSWPAFWLPGQDVTTSNHIPVWVR